MQLGEGTETPTGIPKKDMMPNMLIFGILSFRFICKASGGGRKKSLGEEMEKSQNVLGRERGGNPFKAWPKLKNKTRFG